MLVELPTKRTARENLTDRIRIAQALRHEGPPRTQNDSVCIGGWFLPRRQQPRGEGERSCGRHSHDGNQTPHLLLANVWNKSIDPTGWWMSEKYDGLRAWWDGQKLWTRKGNLIHAPDYFLAELPRDIALDGELWIGHGKFEETMSIVRSENPDDRWNRVRYMVFDAPETKGTFEQRMQFLRVTVSEGNRFVKVVAQERCQGAAQLLAERDRVVREGGEGLMLRQPDSAYEARRSPTLLKVKPYDDAEATVIAHEPGKGKFAGKLGALRVRTEDGREFSIGTGLTDADRESPPPLGTVITYRFQKLTAKGLPRFPSYFRVRRD
ncbi:MAG: DNA ligase [Verrucomicrobiota bacterium]|nr:DNA ligase [Verrucomicrobiota bacterium]